MNYVVNFPPPVWFQTSSSREQTDKQKPFVFLACCVDTNTEMVWETLNKSNESYNNWIFISLLCRCVL